MRTIDHENPLRRQILLNSYGRLQLRYGIVRELLDDVKVCVQLELQEPSPTFIHKRWIETIEFLSDADIDARVIEYQAYLRESHCGDCICVPGTCVKCYVESLLGVDTLPGLGKHEANAIESAFRKVNTRAEAIEWLRSAPITADWEGWESHAERWREERRRAAEWLESQPPVEKYLTPEELHTKFANTFYTTP